MKPAIPERFANRLREGFLRNVIVLLSGTAIAQLLPMMASVFLTRLFTPEEFGLFGLFTAILSIASVAICLRYEHALLIQQDDTESLDIAHICLLLALAISLMWLPILALCRTLFAEAMNSPGLTAAAWFLPAALFLTGCAQVWTLWLLRRQRVELIAKSRIVQAIALTGLSIGFGLIGDSGLWLIVASIASQAAALIWLWSRAGGQLPILRPPPIHIIRNILIRFRRFPFYTVPADLLSAGTMQMPMFFLSMGHGVAFAGVFLLTQRVLGAPLSIIGSAVMDAYKRDAAKLYMETGSCRSLSISTIKNLTAISFLPWIITILWAPDIFRILFGEKWLNSGIICQFLATPLFLRLIVTPTTYNFYISEKQNEDLVAQMYNISSNTIWFLFSINESLSPIETIIGYSVNMTFVYLYYMVRSISLSEKWDQSA